MTIDVFVPGVPQAAGSKRAFPIKRKGGGVGVSVTDANKKAKPWQAAIAEYVPHQKPVWRGPIYLNLAFVFARPKSHYRSGKNAGKLRSTAPVEHTNKPDALKLARAVEDALTGILWYDDSQVVTETISKSWGDAPGVRILAEELETPPTTT